MWRWDTEYSIVIDGDEVGRELTYAQAVGRAKGLQFDKVIQVIYLGTYTCVKRITKERR